VHAAGQAISCPILFPFFPLVERFQRNLNLSEIGSRVHPHTAARPNLLPLTRVCRFVSFVTASMPGKPIFIGVSACRSTTSDGHHHRQIMR